MKYGLALMFAVLALLAAGIAFPMGEEMPRRSLSGKTIMQDNRAIMDRLQAMSGGAALFDGAQARADRTQLIRSFRRVPRLFREPPAAPDSRASQAIWHRWAEFQGRAGRAQRAARNLKTRDRAGLSQTLPGLIRACIDCHDQFRLDAHGRY